MSKFLANIGAALRAPGLADRLQAALAAAGGDTAAIPRLRALQMQQAELQRQNDARNAQVIGAKNMGFGNDEIGALSPQDLSALARDRLAAGPGQPPFADQDDGLTLDRDTALQHAGLAIQRGADPEAVRARLHEMGHFDAEPPSPFSDLIPRDGQPSGIAGHSGAFALPGASSLAHADNGFGKAMGQTANPEVFLDDLRRRADPAMAPIKAGRRTNYSQSGPLSKASERESEIGNTPINMRYDAGNAASRRTSRIALSRSAYAPQGGSRDIAPLAAANVQLGTERHGISRAGSGTNPEVPSPSPWRQGGTMPPVEVERYADLGMRMYQLHRARGMPPQEAAAWAANAAAESHGEYHQPQIHGPAYGIFMWEGARRRMFEEQFHHPIEQSTEAEQLAFRDWELNNTHRGASRIIGRQSSAGDIAAAITRYYETPAAWRIAQLDRSNIAEAIMRRASTTPSIVGGQRPGISPRGSGPARN